MTTSGAAIAGERSRSTAHGIARLVVAVGVALTITGFVVVLFFNPWWVGFEQTRSGADAITGWPMTDVHRVTDSMIGEIYAGSTAFDESIDGQPVLDTRERSHMRDVVNVYRAFLGVAVVGFLLVIVLGALGRGARWFWQGVQAGSAGLIAFGLVGGAAFAVAFDAAFELFHRLLFPAGSFDFDPRTERLVQILPEQLWVETSIAVALVGLALSAGVLLFARRRVRAMDR